MISFLNDYNEVGSKEVLDYLKEISTEKYVGYSRDTLVDEAISLLKKGLANEDVEIHFVHGGTIANVFGIMHCLQRHQSVLSCDTGHIVNTENASIEAVGHQIVLAQNKDGKMTVEEIENALENHSREYNSQIKLVYISNATELGTIYTKDELKSLSECCRKHGLYLFMDGARLGNALVSKYSNMEFSDLTKYLDAFTIGGTKNGFIFGEAVVFVHEELRDNYARMLMKQRGAMLAKGFLYGAQFKVMFEDGLYFRNAENAVKMAEKIVEVFEKYGINFVNRTEANLVFVELEEALCDHISKEIMFEISGKIADNNKCRFVTTWNTKEEEIEILDRVLAEYFI